VATELDPGVWEVQGEKVTLPVEIRAATLASATFLVPAPPVRRIVAPTGLDLVTIPGGRTPLVLTAVDYLDGDLGRYHEVGVCFVVRPSGGSRRGTGALVHRLPVDQAFTLEAGRGIWGFPKWMAQIELGPSMTSCHLAEDGEHILTLSLRPAPFRVPGGRELTMDAYTAEDGVVRRTPWTMRHEQVRMRPGGASLVLGDRHPMAQELRSLGLPRRAAFTSIAGRVTGRFGSAVVV
jgi:hypothetical protein